MRQLIIGLIIILLISLSLVTCLQPIGAEIIMSTFNLWIAPENGYFSYIGEVKNTGYSTAYKVVVRIEVFYKDGDLFNIKIASTNPPDIEPNTHGKWRIDYKHDIQLIDFDKTRYEIFWE